jgi:hypothetical protein
MFDLPQHSNIPSFHHSNIPTFQHSNIPTFQHSLGGVFHDEPGRPWANGNGTGYIGPSSSREEQARCPVSPELSVAYNGRLLTSVLLK